MFIILLHFPFLNVYDFIDDHGPEQESIAQTWVGTQL